jgi:hypothetical protein
VNEEKVVDVLGRAARVLGLLGEAGESPSYDEAAGEALCVACERMTTKAQADGLNGKAIEARIVTGCVEEAKRITAEIEELLGS